MREIAITDIHGCRKSFLALLHQLNLQAEDHLYFLGDYVDRGPDSRGVIDTLSALKNQCAAVRFLRGNHEEGMLQARNDDYWLEQWLTWGGYATIRSFQVENLKDIPQVYWDFLEATEFYIASGKYLLVHAGFNFDCRDPLSDEHAMLWIRNWENSINLDWLGDRYILHGHTPTPASRIQERLKTLDIHRVLDIDAGCFAKHLPGLGMLCAFDMSNRKLYFQENID